MSILPTFRPIVLIALIVLSGRYAIGQDNYFPEVGDTLYILVDRAPEYLDLDKYQHRPTWDISTVKAPYLRPIVPLNPTTTPHAEHFPGANYALHMDDRTIHFYKREGRELYLMGQFGMYIYDQFIPVPVRFNFPFIVNFPSGEHRQEWNYSSQAVVEFPTSLFLPVNMAKLPVKADSMRVIINMERRTTEDGQGFLKYEIITDEASRYYTIEEYGYRALLKVGNKPWQDFSTYIDKVEAFGSPLRYRYDFFIPDSGVPISTVWINPHTRQPDMVKYWVRAYLDRFNRPVQHTDPDIYAFPNPAIGYVHIELSNLKPGSYRIALFNFLAQEVFQMPVEVNSDETVRIDITEFDKGPYLYALIDQYGRRMITKRLTILKP